MNKIGFTLRAATAVASKRCGTPYGERQNNTLGYTVRKKKRWQIEL